MLYRWLFFILFIGLIQWYSFQCIKTVSQNKYLWSFYIIISFVITGNFIFQVLNYDRSEGFTHAVSYSLGFFISLFVLSLFLTKMRILFSLFFLLTDQLWSFLIQKVIQIGSGI